MLAAIGMEAFAERARRELIATGGVEWHLRHVFAKLGISSRSQLRQTPTDQSLMSEYL